MSASAPLALAAAAPAEASAAAPTEPSVTAAIATPAEATPKEAKTPSIPWRKSTIALVSPEKVFEISEAIQTGRLVSGAQGISWSGKYSPRAEIPSKIISFLLSAPDRRLHFQMLIIKLKLGLNLKNELQAYLRELLKQGIVTVL